MSWAKIRVEAMDQCDCYAIPDKTKKPVWDGRGGPRLLRRLRHFAIKDAGPPDFDKILAAAEWIIEQARDNGVVTPDKKDNLIGHRAALLLDDGSVIFKLRSLAATAKKESVGIVFEDLRDAAHRYGKNYWPVAAGLRHRYYIFSDNSIKEIENELIRLGKSTCI